MTAYYNEIEPNAAQWLRNLIAAGHIAPGDVDERSIADVRADDLRGYTQCHFFAGVGVWPHALRLAGWPDDEEAWSGSCPCQAFSIAGSGRGFADERHLWPDWFRLISEQRPRAVFGEQVASKDGLAWLDFVCADMESAGYAIAPLDLCAAGFGADHARQRLFFVADAQRGWVEERRGIADSRQEGTLGSRVPSPLSPGLPQQARAVVEQVQLDRITQQAGWGTESQPVAVSHGTPGRVGRMRAYGNSIFAPAAAEFIRAYRATTLAERGTI